MKRKFDFTVFLISLGAGLIWAAAGNALYQLLLGKIRTPLLIGILFFGLTVFTYLAVWISDTLRKGTEYTELFSVKTVLVGICIFAMAVLFEFIYEIQPGFNLFNKPTGYAFVIDDSASMLENDPDNRRTSSIEEVMKNCEEDVPYVVYRFSAVCNRITDQLTARDSAGREYAFRCYGVTDVQNALELAADELIENAVDLGNSPRILLFSDGIADDENMEDLIAKLNRASISVCAVACGKADMEFLGKIAEGTGGVAVNVDDIDSLSVAFTKVAAVRQEAGRNLLGSRRKESKDWIYAALRILFLLLLTVAFMLFKLLGFYTKDTKNTFFYLLLLLSILAVLAMEFGNRLFPAYGVWFRSALFVAFALLLGEQTGAGNYQQPAGSPGGASYGGMYMQGAGNRGYGDNNAYAGGFGSPWSSQPGGFTAASGNPYGGNSYGGNPYGMNGGGGSWSAAYGSAMPTKRKEISLSSVIAVIAGASFVFVIVLLVILGTAKTNGASSGNRAATADSYGSYASRQAAPRSVRNGEIITAPEGTCTCDFYGKVCTPYYNYYICLTGTKPENNMSFYIEGGQEVTLKVPKDNYKVSFYKGNTWYGKGTKFGDDTIHEEIDELCRYNNDGDTLGYLFEVTNGTLSSTKLNADS